jgi:hypothetical protein
MMRRRKADKASGKRHEPLHTLKECCEAAGVSPQWFGRWAAQYPGAPKPVQGVYHNHRTPYYNKREVVQWIKQLKEQLSNQKGTFIMPSLQDALKQAIERTNSVPSEWDDEPDQTTPQTTQTTQPQETSVQPTQTTHPVPSSAFKPTNNVTRETFNYVRDNPGISRIKATNDLVAKGFSGKTVSALISQMVQQEMFHRDNYNCLRALVPEYTPLKTYSTVVTKKLAELMPRAHLRMVMRDGKRMLIEDKPKPRKKAVAAPKRTYTRRTQVVDTVEAAPLPVTMVEEPVVVAPAVRPQVTGNDILNQLTLVQAKQLYDELKKFFGDTK